MKSLEKFIKWAEELLRRDDEETDLWAMFFNLTLISIVVILVVIYLEYLLF